MAESDCLLRERIFRPGAGNETFHGPLIHAFQGLIGGRFRIGLLLQIKSCRDPLVMAT